MADFGDLRLLRDNALRASGALTQDFHAEGHRGRGHCFDMFRCSSVTLHI